jgi:mycothiol synthase
MPEPRVLEHFTDADVTAVRALADAVEGATGASPFGEVTWTGLAGRGTLGDRGVLLGGADGAAAAYVHFAHHNAGEWSAEVATQVGREATLPGLLAIGLDAVGAAGGGHVTLWLHGETELPREIAGLGFAPERELLEMRVSLPLSEPAAWPDGVTVRSFVVGQDEDAWLEVNNRTFAGHPEQGGWTRATIEQREQADWFDPDGFLLAFDADGLAGSCWTKVHPADPPKEPAALGEIYAIGADPSRQGRGLGRALTVGGLESLAARGITEGMLFVDTANAAAVGLYRSLGFVTHRVDRAYGLTVASSP